MENIWLISIAALVVGAIIGFLLGRSGGSNQRQAELAEKLEKAQQELDNYKAEVTDHFEKTAALVNNLTNSYKDVHHHLATGAQGLCQPGSVDMALEPPMANKLEQEEAKETSETPTGTPESSTPEQPEPPRDYAPKSPEDEGTLSETFGLKEDANQDEEHPEQPPVADAAKPSSATEAKA